MCGPSSWHACKRLCGINLMSQEKKARFLRIANPASFAPIALIGGLIGGAGAPPAAAGLL